MSVFTIQLRDLRFFAFHGLHPEEKLMGTNFLVDVDVTTSAPDSLVTDIDQTVDYVRIHNIISAVMQEPTPLLETCCMKIAEDIRNALPLARSASITITKLSPPITNFSGKVAVSYRKAFD